LGGSVALSSHGAKAALRIAANTSPEPFSNIGLSVLEDMFAISSSVILAWFPIVLLGAVLIFLSIAIWLAPKILRALRSLFSGEPQLAKRPSLSDNR